MKGNVIQIDHKTAVDFLLPRHYSGRTPPISIAFGWYSGGELKAVCTFGKPASHSLCIGVCGEENESHVYELNRLCRVPEWHEPLSAFVSACLRRLRVFDWIIVSFSDTAMGHHGYIYQACNFLYTGATKARTDKYTPNGKHSRHYQNYVDLRYRKVRSAKHRYVYFCTHNRHLKKQWMESLRYPVEEYPKGDNENYVLGEYLQDKIIEVKA